MAFLFRSAVAVAVAVAVVVAAAAAAAEAAESVVAESTPKRLIESIDASFSMGGESVAVLASAASTTYAASAFASASSTTASTTAAAVVAVAPQWMHDVADLRTRLFLAIVEPIVVAIFGPVEQLDGYDCNGGFKVGDGGIRSGGGGAHALLWDWDYYDGDGDGDGGGDGGGSRHPCHYRGNLGGGGGDEDNDDDLSAVVRLTAALDGHGNATTTTAETTANTMVGWVLADETRHRHRRLGFLPNYIEDVSSLRETSMSFLTLVMLFTIMVCLFLVLMSCFYHNQKTSPLFISPRRHRLPKLVPPPLPVDGFFSWVKVCFYISDEEIIDRIGYDALIFIRFHRLALRCIVKMSVFSFIVLLPLNYTGGGHANASDLKGYVGSLLFTDFLRFTMANVSGGSPRLWVHCFAAYLLTGIVVWELLVEYNAFNNVRHRYLLSREPHLRTVLVSNIPRHLRSPSKIGTYFRHVYPNAVKSVSICQNLIQLERLVTKRTGVLSKIEQNLLLLCREEKKKLLGRTRLQRCRRALCSCYLFEKLGLVYGKQERLAILYARLEALNDDVHHELKRRKKVMRQLDTMESDTGKYDIDYILATPFVIDASPCRGKDGRGGSGGGGGRCAKTSPGSGLGGGYRPPVHTGAPRNPDGTVDSVVLPPTPTIDAPSGGPTLRTSASGGNTLEAERFAQEEEVEEDESANLDIDLDDANQKRPRRAHSRAKAAIRRYTRFMTRGASGDDEDLGGGSASVGGGSSVGVDYDDRVRSSRGGRGRGRGGGSFALRGHIEDHTNEVCDKAFVVMRTFTASTIAIQSMHSSKPGSMEVTTAPEPRDILWENVYLSKGAKRTRSYIGEALILLIITFYVVPVALVSLLVSESALISSSPRLAQLDHASAFFSMGIAMVQPICLVGIQQLLPPLFMLITKAEGVLSFSEVQMKVFSRYFLFQVLNVFLVTAIAGSIFDTIAIIIENPETMFEMLGNALPRMSSFFITFVIMKTFLGLGLELVRLTSLFQAMMRYILFPNSTLRAQRSIRIGMRAIDDPGWFPFHKILAQDMLVVVISIVFAVVAPVVLFPCALFCSLSRIMWTHHHMYIYESVFETGGQFWPKIFRRFVFGLIIAQMTITGQFILKEARHEAYATIALSFLTYFFLRSTRARYDAPSSTLPLEVATVMDISVSQEEHAKRRARLADAANARQPLRESTDQGNTDGAGAGAARNRSNSRNVEEVSEDDDEPGAAIGEINPFDQAYLQPALRANPRARPEQPFPPAQLGREDVFLGLNTFGSTLGVIGEEDVVDDSATVRLKCFNQQDRAMIDQWWQEQIVQSGEQNLLGILTGEESGTLRIGPPMQLECDQLDI